MGIEMKYQIYFNRLEPVYNFGGTKLLYYTVRKTHKTIAADNVKLAMWKVFHYARKGYDEKMRVKFRVVFSDGAAPVWTSRKNYED